MAPMSEVSDNKAAVCLHAISMSAVHKKLDVPRALCGTAKAMLHIPSKHLDW
jgi:hypothetical protein